ncbi:MAG: ABC transporter six-transmembrane domain-containing protein [Planctomycetaceae bacterium]
MLALQSAPTILPPRPRTEPTGAVASPLRLLFAANRAKLLLTYLLFNIENLLRLSQPLVLGLAINDLLHDSSFGLLLFVGLHLTHLLISSLRQMYDTRVFTGIYTELATKLIAEQRGREIGTSRVAARSSLSREFVEFFENQVPLLIKSLYSVIGALVLLAFYDRVLVPICLGLLLPAVVLNRIYSRRTFELSRQLHDELENEVDVIDNNHEPAIRRHYDAVATWRVKLSDSEALNFGTMELFVLGVMVLALLRTCSLTAATPGDIFAVFRYVLMLLMGFDGVPKLVQQFSRLRDLSQRFRRA